MSALNLLYNSRSISLPCAGVSVSAVFDQTAKALLILGGPGAGKTTLLLELARDLLDQAKQDLEHPLPVVFNLSSWAARPRPLAEWLVDELRERYVVPRKLGQAWVEGDLILPLLDGLDEVTRRTGRAVSWQAMPATSRRFLPCWSAAGC